MLILARQAAASAPTRLGITASRKIGGAVVRNRAKRLVRVAFRALPELFAPGIDLVVIVKKPLTDLALADVIAEWRGVAGKVGQRLRALLARAVEEGKTRGRGGTPGSRACSFFSFVSISSRCRG